MESEERIWGRAWMHISDNPSILFILAFIFLIIRLLVGKREKT